MEIQCAVVCDTEKTGHNRAEIDTRMSNGRAHPFPLRSCTIRFLLTNAYAYAKIAWKISPLKRKIALISTSPVILNSPKIISKDFSLTIALMKLTKLKCQPSNNFNEERKTRYFFGCWFFFFVFQHEPNSQRTFTTTTTKISIFTVHLACNWISLVGPNCSFSSIDVTVEPIPSYGCLAVCRRFVLLSNSNRTYEYRTATVHAYYRLCPTATTHCRRRYSLLGRANRELLPNESTAIYPMCVCQAANMSIAKR